MGRTAAAIIAWDSARPEVTDPNEAADKANSPAGPSQGAAAGIGDAPDPATIRTNLIPKGNIEKFIWHAFHRLIIERRAASGPDPCAGALCQKLANSRQISTTLFHTFRRIVATSPEFRFPFKEECRDGKRPES
jgi:hypothetical protein